MLAVAACSAAPAGGDGEGARAAGDRDVGVAPDRHPQGEMLIFAAASLTDAFEALAVSFAREYPEVTVLLSFASSSTLATQILEGAPADVYASADQASMDRVSDEGLVATRALFARNMLEIAVEAGNPWGITNLDDLARDALTLVLAAPQVPAGRLAAELLAAHQIDARPSSLETDVRSALSRVALGEADAAIVYRSDLVSAPSTVEAVVIPDKDNTSTDYPIATLRDAPNPPAAQAWVEHVHGPEGRAVLDDAGFVVP